MKQQMEDIDHIDDTANNHSPIRGKKINVDLKHFSQQNMNRLPINLFHSAAEYNKMLITNGKSIQKSSQPQIDGFLNSLEFINESIYESNEQKREIRKREVQVSATRVKRKPLNNNQCLCCCCDNYCLICAKESTKRKTITHPNIMKSQLIFPFNPKKSSDKKSKKKPKTSKTTLKQYNSTHRGKSEKDLKSSYLSHKKFNIDRLICQSLIRFEEEKRERKLKKVIKEKCEVERRGMLKDLNEKIRNQNMESHSKNKSETN